MSESCREEAATLVNRWYLFLIIDMEKMDANRKVDYATSEGDSEIKIRNGALCPPDSPQLFDFHGWRLQLPAASPGCACGLAVATRSGRRGARSAVVPVRDERPGPGWGAPRLPAGASGA